MSTPRATLSQAHDSNVWSLAYHPFGHILVSASNDHTTRFWSRERPGDASSVFSGGGEKPPEIIDTSGQDEDEDAMVPGFGGGAWWVKDEDGGAPNEGGGGGGGLAEYPDDDDFIPGFAKPDTASRPNGPIQILPPFQHQHHQQQQQENMYGGGEERRFDEFGRDRDVGSRSAVAGNNNDDWGRGGGGGGAHRSARFGPRRGGRY